MKVCIVIPAYNEEKRIGNTLKKYAGFFKTKNNETDNFDILIVLNNCTDGTEDIVREHSLKNENISFINFQKKGKGFAIIEGFKNAFYNAYDLMGFVDADMATSPEAFYELITNIGRNDGIIASRGMKESIVKTNFIRKLTNRGFNLLVRLILHLPYLDTQCGAKLFKQEAVEELINKKNIADWAFDVDLLYKLKKKNFKILEIPTVWDDKKGSKIKLIKTPVKMFISIIRLRLLYSPFKFIVRLYDKLTE